jgi:hypothetical protein
MYVHQGNGFGPVVGPGSFIVKGSCTEIVFPDSKSVRMEDSDINTRRVAVQLWVNSVPRMFLS